VLGPIFAGCMGAPFSLERSAGCVIERGAWALLHALPDYFERAYFGSLLVASYTFPFEHAVPFRELALRAQKPLELGAAHVPGFDLLQRFADRCYASARATLFTWLLLLAAADGLALLAVHLTANRSRRART